MEPPIPGGVPVCLPPGYGPMWQFFFWGGGRGEGGGGRGVPLDSDFGSWGGLYGAPQFLETTL